MKAYQWGLVTVILILGTYNVNLAFLLFIISFQVANFYIIVQNITLYYRVKEWPKIHGTVSSKRRITGEEDRADMFEYEVHFSTTYQDYDYVILYPTNDVLDIHNEVEIGLNIEKPSQSIVLKKFNSYWRFKQFASIIISVLLFYVDYFLVQRLELPRIPFF